MKKLITLMIPMLFLFVGVGNAQSNHTITIDGSNDFNTSYEQFTDITVADDAYFTWDANNIYFGIADAEADYGNMATFIYFVMHYKTKSNINI